MIGTLLVAGSGLFQHCLTSLCEIGGCNLAWASPSIWVIGFLSLAECFGRYRIGGLIISEGESREKKMEEGVVALRSRCLLTVSGTCLASHRSCFYACAGSVMICHYWFKVSFRSCPVCSLHHIRYRFVFGHAHCIGSITRCHARTRA
jgi:hypothetical protein